jgi:glycosyltransferase involved in cell wall biosynthesis
MNGDWGGQQTFAIQSATHPWVLFVDADERISEALAEEIKEVVARGEQKAYWIRRENRFHFNKATHGILHPDYVNRLFPAKGSYVEGYVHPKIVAPYPDKRLKHPMYHYTYDNWEQYLGKLNNYTTLAAKKYKKENKRCNFFLDIVLRPLWAFIKAYILELGFLDGRIGWILSVNHYFYTLNKYVKLYYLYKSDGKL